MVSPNHDHNKSPSIFRGEIHMYLSGMPFFRSVFPTNAPKSIIIGCYDSGSRVLGQRPRILDPGPTGILLMHTGTLISYLGASFIISFKRLPGGAAGAVKILEPGGVNPPPAAAVDFQLEGG